MCDQKITGRVSVQGSFTREDFTRRVADILTGEDAPADESSLEQALRLFMSKYALYSGGYLLSHLGRAITDWNISSVLSGEEEDRNVVWVTIEVIDHDLIDMTVFLPLPANTSRCCDYFDHRFTGEERAIYLSYESVPEELSMTGAEPA